MLWFLYFDFKSECFARDIIQKTLSRNLAPRIIRASSRNPNQGRRKGKGKGKEKGREKGKEEKREGKRGGTPQGKFLPPRREIFILKGHFLFPLGPLVPGGGG